MGEQAQILFVDDDPRAGELMSRFAESASFKCSVFRDPHEALAQFEARGADLVISDLRMPSMDGIELLTRLRALDGEVPVILVTAYSTVDDAIEALRLGATDFIKKPYDMDELLIQVEHTLEDTRLRKENRLLRRQLSDERSRYGMAGRSAAMREVYGTIDKIADIRCSVVIEGESGTGKELAARAIHHNGQFADLPFVVIDCGALSDTLLESELFGHEKGSFTGAARAKPGLLEIAAGGTVFLDEIGNISDAMQSKLLRVVQERQLTRVGGLKPIEVDVRFIVATHQHLEDMVREGRFRHDLYHRLNVVKIEMPPLRKRPEDIAVLTQLFVEEFAERYNRSVEGFDAASMRRISEYSWPGNVRELRNLVERHIALADGPRLHLDRLGEAPAPHHGGLDADLPTLAELERRYIFKVLGHHQGNRERSATTLGINKSTLWRKLQLFSERESGPDR